MRNETDEAYRNYLRGIIRELLDYAEHWYVHGEAGVCKYCNLPKKHIIHMRPWGKLDAGQRELRG